MFEDVKHAIWVVLVFSFSVVFFLFAIMVSFCSVNGCDKESYPGCGISFHKLPKDQLMKEKWIKMIPGNITKSSIICNVHFQEQDFQPNTFNKLLKSDAVPSIFPVSTVAAPRRELIAPKLCISKGPECFVQIPTLKSVLLKPKSEVQVPTICISQGPERCIEISPLTAELLKPKSELPGPTICISQGPERCIEISPLTSELPQQPSKRVVVPLVVESVTSQNIDPLFLENEPMDAIEDNTAHSVSVKSENEEEDEDETSNNSSSSYEAEFLEEDTPPSSPSPTPTNCIQNKLTTPNNYMQNQHPAPTKYIQKQLPASTPTTSMQNQFPAPIPTNYIQNQLPAPTPTNYMQNQFPAPIPTSTNFMQNQLPAPTPSNYIMQNQQRALRMSQEKRADLRKRLKTLQQKLNRRQVKQEKFTKLIKSVKDYTKSSEIENILNGNFKELCAAVHNNGVTVNYSDKVIKFALTVYNYSPEAYEFIRKYMSLPHTRMLQKYAATGAYCDD